MTDNIVPSIEKLPVELFHRIFDNLDTETIIFSVRPVSRLFRSIVSTYNRYDLDLNLISKSNMKVLCRFINSQNVISLILSNDGPTSDQINLFLKLISTEQFIRLRSLSLFDVHEDQLKIILEKINPNLLKEFSFRIRRRSILPLKPLINLLSSTIEQATLHKLTIHLKCTSLSNISWPCNSTIQYLNINDSIDTNDLSQIFKCCPHLSTLIIKNIPSIRTDDLPSECIRQLTSLTIKEFSSYNIDSFESFLLMTPSLVYLQLSGNSMIDGNRWEKFITMNLSKLDKFEFSCSSWSYSNITEKEFESTISSFQTPFWIEHKKWFVIYEYVLRTSYGYTILLNSLSMRKSSVLGDTNSQYISNIKSDLLITDNINSLKIMLNKSVADIIQEKKTTTNHPLFPKVTEIDIRFCDDWPLLSLQTLSTFIDISQIVRITISNSYDFKNYDQNTWLDIVSFINQARNVSSLSIQHNIFVIHNTKCDHTTQSFYSILPRHIKHLQISINDMKQIDRIFDRCVNLSTITFNPGSVGYTCGITNWFTENTVESTCRHLVDNFTVWIGKRKLIG